MYCGSLIDGLRWKEKRVVSKQSRATVARRGGRCSAMQMQCAVTSAPPRRAPQPVRSFETLRIEDPAKQHVKSSQCEVLTPLTESFERINRAFGAGG